MGIITTFLLALSAFTEKNEAASTIAAIHRAIIPLWPSIWVWLQVFHKKNRMHSSMLHSDPYVDNDTLHARYTCIHGILLQFMLNSEERTGLRNLLSHANVLEMLAELWIEESKHSEAFYGFWISPLQFSAFKGISPNSDLSTDLLNRIVASCGGNKDDFVRLFCSRLKNNMKQLEPDGKALLRDFVFISEQFHARTEAAILRDAFLSNAAYVVVSMIDTLSLLVNSLSKETDIINPLKIDLFYYPLDLIDGMIRSSRPYAAIAQLLDASFFTLLNHLAHWSLPRSTGSINALGHIFQVLLRFTVHRPLLSAMNRNLLLAFPGPMMPAGPTKACLRMYHAGLIKWNLMEEEYQKRLWTCNVICGNPQVCAKVLACFFTSVHPDEYCFHSVFLLIARIDCVVAPGVLSSLTAASHVRSVIGKENTERFVSTCILQNQVNRAFPDSRLYPQH